MNLLRNEDTPTPAISRAEYKTMEETSDISLLLSLTANYPFAQKAFEYELEAQALDVEARSYNAQTEDGVDRETADEIGRLRAQASLKHAERRAFQTTLRLTDHMIVDRVAKMTSTVIKHVSPKPQTTSGVASSREVGKAKEKGLKEVEGAKALFDESLQTNQPLDIDTDPFVYDLKKEGLRQVEEALGTEIKPGRLPRDEAQRVMQKAKTDKEFAKGFTYALSVLDINPLVANAADGTHQDELNNRKVLLRQEENQRRQQIPVEDARRSMNGELSAIKLIANATNMVDDEWIREHPNQLASTIADIRLVYSYMVNGE